MPRGPALSPRAASAGMLVAGAFALLNVFSFGFSVLAARALGPSGYGVLGSMMNLLLIVNVVAMGLQAAAARRIAVAPSRTATTVRVVRRTSWWAGWAVAGGTVVLAPALVRLLRLDSAWPIWLLAVSGCALAVLGGRLGTLQGTEHWRGFAGSYVAFGVTRLAFGWAGVLVRPDASGAFAGVTLSLVVTAGAAAVAEHRVLPVPPSAARDSVRATRGFVVESGHAMTMLFAFFALSSVDVLMARATLSPHDAGLYAAGQILAKSVLFLPSFVSVVAFPRLARDGRDGRDRLHLVGLALVLGLGAVAVLATALFPRVALVFAGGSDFAEITGALWQFAALGAVLGGIQLLVTTALARRHTRAVWVLWGALGAMALAAPSAATWVDLLLRVLAVDVALLLILVVLTRGDHITGSDVAAPGNPG